MNNYNRRKQNFVFSILITARLSYVSIVMTVISIISQYLNLDLINDSPCEKPCKALITALEMFR